MNTSEACRVGYYETSDRRNRIKLMKTQIIKRLGSGFALALLPFVGACNQQSGEATESLVTTAPVEAVVESADDTDSAANELPELAVAPAKTPELMPVPPEKTLPPNINPSSALAEVIKLAQAGVDETVLYAFVTNSTSVFGLGSDEIIYLNDLGLPGPLVTTMIEHDQAVKRNWTRQAQAQTAAAAPANTTPAPETAAGPAYINPPQPEPAPSAQPVQVSNNYFYETLSPYGSWVNVSGYGMCWRPTVAVVNPGWQPYADRGRWVYSDAGWYWLSDYSWGATAFHYGRWFNQPNIGWCWWPDTVWAPSWVSWRYSSGYCGWAPLPPAARYRSGVGFTYYGNSVGVSFSFGLSANCYTFVPTAYFCSPRPYNYRVPAHQRTTVYNQTVVANNYIVGNNNTVINNGIPVTQVAAATGSDIRPVPIREAGAGSRPGGRRERLESGGRAITVNRPSLPPTQEAAAPAIVAGNTPSPTVQPSGSTRANNPGSSLSGQRSSQREPFGFNSRRSHTGGNTAAAPAAGPTTEVTAAPVPQNPPVARPESRPDRNRPDNNSRPSPGRNSGGGTSPLIIRGSDVASSPAAPVTAPVLPGTPSSSLVVIGGREGNTPANRSLNGRPSSREHSTTASAPRQIMPAPGQSPTAPVTTAPSSSLIVIGNRDSSAAPSRNVFASQASRNNSSRPATATSTFQATPVPNQSAPAPVVAVPSANRSAPSQFTSSAPQSHRQQTQRATRSNENRPAPTATYSAPAPAPRQSAPVTPSYSVPASPSAGVAQTAPPSVSRGFGSQPNSGNARRDR